jgi:uncharacterized RDD family membrane protein YckC
MSTTAPSRLGERAGVVTRLTACAIDVAVVTFILVVALASFSVVRFLLTSHSLQLPHPGRGVTFALWYLIALVYLVESWTTSGRTVGNRVIGHRVRTRDDRQVLSVPRAFLRSVWCILIGGPSMLWIAVSRHNYGLHDIAFHTEVVYDWTQD